MVMTGTASGPPHRQPHIRNKSRREALAKRLRDPADPLHWRHDGQWRSGAWPGERVQNSPRGRCGLQRGGASRRAREDEDGSGYADVPGFCKSAALGEVRRHGHVLTPGRYVGAEPQADDGELFESKMTRLVAELRAQQAEGARLGAAIGANLAALGFGDDAEERKPS